MSYPAYPSHKDTEAKWLGKIPQHWELRRARQLGNFSASGIDKKDVDGELPVKMINYTDVYKSKTKLLQFDDALMTTTAAPAKVAVHSVRDGDILLTPSSETADDIGHAALVALMPEGVVYSYHILRFRTLSDVVPKFLTYCFNAAPTRAYFSSVCTGTTRMVLGRDDFKNALISLPSMSEQSAIASFLDRETAKIDTLIDKKQQLIKLLEEKRQAVISNAVTKGLSPDVQLKDSGVEWLGAVPEHWEVGLMKRFCQVIDCKHLTAEFVDEGIPLASIGEVKGWTVDLANAKKTTEEFYSALVEGGRRPEAGDIIYSRNASVGEAALVRSDHPKFAMGQDVCLLRPSSEAESEFLLLQLSSALIVSQLDAQMVGATFKRINVDAVRNFTVVVPPRSEQIEIIGYLQAVIRDYAAIVTMTQKALSLLQERRTALISAAVTGKIDVRNVA